VGVGCLVDSCQHCPSCSEGLEQYCENTFVATYNSRTPDAPGHTLGGYSQRIVVSDKFVLKIRHPREQLAAVSPLLCAGITTYSPLRHWQAGPGKKVGIGGLCHMGVKIAHAMGAHTVAFTTSESKRRDALNLGADEVVVRATPMKWPGRRACSTSSSTRSRPATTWTRIPDFSSAMARWCWSVCQNTRIHRPAWAT
jgi:alcohol dehydrogenase (NADP+)